MKIIPTPLIVPKKYLGDKEAIAGFLELLVKSDELPEGVYAVADDGRTMFEGSSIFKLKDTYGLPIEMAIGTIMDKGIPIRWVSFIEAARRNKWWDFQTYDVMEQGMQDAGCDKAYIYEVMQRFKLFVLAYPHPEMKGE